MSFVQRRQAAEVKVRKNGQIEVHTAQHKASEIASPATPFERIMESLGTQKDPSSMETALREELKKIQDQL
jgi:hypothetical protein